MKFTWDENKRLLNIKNHEIDFFVAEKIYYSEDASAMVDDRKDYGEERYLIYGTVDSLKMCLCCAFRDDNIRVISIRRVHDKEWRKVYGY